VHVGEKNWTSMYVSTRRDGGREDVIRMWSAHACSVNNLGQKMGKSFVRERGEEISKSSGKGGKRGSNKKGLNRRGKSLGSFAVRRIRGGG